MNINLEKLHLEFRRSSEVVEFPRISYFFGPIGSGKSSIARLLDFCLGADVEWTPVLQQELVSASLEISVNETQVTVHRTRDSGMVVVAWSEGKDTLQVTLPARDARGEVLLNTGVEVLSDLIFYLANVEPPKVRRRKGMPDEQLERLSLRDLYLFCYLDQDRMDNSFFRLNSENYAIRRKSVDTLRYLLGYKQEKVAELESQLQAIREDRMARAAGAAALAKALTDAGFDDALAIDQRIEEVKAALDVARRKSKEARSGRQPLPHAVDELRGRVRTLVSELTSTDDALAGLDTRIEDIARHGNELKMLSVRFQRTAAARSVLGGVDFTSCPRCTQSLPKRKPECCPVCGQLDHIIEGNNNLDEVVVSQDIRVRQEELADVLSRMRAEKRRLTIRSSELKQERVQCEAALSAQLHDYDSAFLSQAVENERVVATLEQKLNSLLHNRKLPDVLVEQKGVVDDLHAQEVSLRERLEKLRQTTFRDAKNIERLGELFLDCLLAVKFPDVKASYHVQIDPSTFTPQIMLSEGGDFIALSFANAGSGGMKSLFKTCFALAVHRLCVAIGSQLPNLLVVDTATKNVSSIENPEVIGSFYDFVYRLAATELANTQFVIIDNEFTWPEQNVPLNIVVRHMMNGSSKYPPLVPYAVDTGAADASG
jgi:rubrerythrin